MALQSPGDTVLLERAIRTVSPWLMAQHFATRICAQIMFRKLYKAALDSDSKTMFETKYEILKSCVDATMRQGNHAKNIEKLEKGGFFLNEFHPGDCFNLMDIFFHLPARLGLLSHEYDCFKEAFVMVELDGCEKIPFKSNAVEEYLPDVTDPADPLYFEIAASENQNQIVQKKITPWSDMFSDDLNTNCNEEEAEKTPEHPNLIMIAALIDKVPNLGGLCRTCEILGVGEYVISSQKVTDEKDFKVRLAEIVVLLDVIIYSLWIFCAFSRPSV